ncbi:MAG: 5-oxoprolinase subunit PxpA [Bryobacteraceae bacterium]
MRLDLNCDLGELDDEALEARLMEHITSANIACGGHAGDEGTMERTVRLALQRGVNVGAHPGYPDRANFGRVEIAMGEAEIEDTVAWQIGRLEAVAGRLGATIVHVKPHGALYNVAVGNQVVARAIGAAVRGDKQLAGGLAGGNACPTLFGLAGSHMIEVWRGMGLRVASEGFADRRYEADGTLRSRKLPDALITDPAEAAEQAVRLALEGGVETICVHGDTPGAADILRACRRALQSCGCG